VANNIDILKVIFSIIEFSSHPSKHINWISRIFQQKEVKSVTSLGVQNNDSEIELGVET